MHSFAGSMPLYCFLPRLERAAATSLTLPSSVCSTLVIAYLSSLFLRLLNSTNLHKSIFNSSFLARETLAAPVGLATHASIPSILILGRLSNSVYHSCCVIPAYSLTGLNNSGALSRIPRLRGTYKIMLVYS
jgi:hypothetical protein